MLQHYNADGLKKLIFRLFVLLCYCDV